MIPRDLAADPFAMVVRDGALNVFLGQGQRFSFAIRSGRQSRWLDGMLALASPLERSKLADIAATLTPVELPALQRAIFV